MTNVVTLWVGRLNELPLRIADQVEIESINTLITPVMSLKYQLALLDKRDEDVVPCASCLDNLISSTTSYYKLALVPGRGIHPIVQYDLMILCNGCKDHICRDKFKVTLKIYL